MFRCDLLLDTCCQDRIQNRPRRKPNAIGEEQSKPLINKGYLTNRGSLSESLS
jgi:hypothetical protein